VKSHRAALGDSPSFIQVFLCALDAAALQNSLRDKIED
jgi:hypothetical protein